MPTCATVLLSALCSIAGAQQLSIPRVDLLPDRPSPYVLRDWRKTAIAFDRTVFDLKSKGPGLPLVWRVPGVPNLRVPGFGFPSYVGGEKKRMKTAEGIAAIGALLGASAVGIDERSWVELTPQYLKTSEGLVLNNVNGRTGDTFWYELLPNLDFIQLASLYQNWSRGQTISKGIADSWIRGIDGLGGNFDHTAYNFTTRKAFDNKLWKEPDSAGAVAYIELFQGLRSGNKKYVAAARRALRSFQERETNPTYEVVTAYGVLSAAYLNATSGDRWDVPRFLGWCFDPTSPNRPGWGMIVGRWGAYDAGGLIGSTNDSGGYAFAMNTFVNAATLAPVARYDSRFSASIAKWLLNLTNASRLFYRDTLPAAYQSSAAWKGDPNNGLAYEGLRRTWEGKSPYATGDAKRGDPKQEDLGLYGGGYVGLLGALVHGTNVPMILRIDLRATDFLPAKGYPTDLFWNPYPQAKAIELALGSNPVRPYDAVSHRFLSRKPVRGTCKFLIAPQQAIQLVRVPAKGALVYEANRTCVQGVPIDFNNGRVPLPPPVKHTRRDASVIVPVSHVNPDGTIAWAKSGSIGLNGGVGSKMHADLRFAWDPSYLYFQITQRTPTTAVVEPPTTAELAKHWWDFEDVVLCFDLGREQFAAANIPEITVGWSSSGAKNVAYSPGLAQVETTTSGSAKTSNRTIRGRIKWSELYRAVGTHKPFGEILKVGAKIGCQPLMVDGTFRRQAYVGGTRYTRPSGFDANSRTLLLEER